MDAWGGKTAHFAHEYDTTPLLGPLDRGREGRLAVECAHMFGWVGTWILCDLHIHDTTHTHNPNHNPNQTAKALKPPLLARPALPLVAPSKPVVLLVNKARVEC